MHIQKTDVFVSRSGGSIDYESEDGEILLSVEVPPGVQPALDYLHLAPEGSIMKVAEGLAVVSKGIKAFGRQPYGAGATNSGANPLFQPSSADRNQREMRLQINRMVALNDAAERRLNAAASIERIPRAPVEPAPEVIEPPAPQPEAKA